MKCRRVWTPNIICNAIKYKVESAQPLFSLKEQELNVTHIADLEVMKFFYKSVTNLIESATISQT